MGAASLSNMLPSFPLPYRHPFASCVPQGDSVRPVWGDPEVSFHAFKGSYLHSDSLVTTNRKTQYAASQPSAPTVYHDVGITV